MTVKNLSPKKYAVRNFLLRSVRETAPEPTRLMTELALYQKFQVNRETVRNAIHDLEVSNIVQRIPGKKGIYSHLFSSKQASKQAFIYKGLLQFN